MGSLGINPIPVDLTKKDVLGKDIQLRKKNQVWAGLAVHYSFAKEVSADLSRQRCSRGEIW
jgi:hypothetical protein